MAEDTTTDAGDADAEEAQEAEAAEAEEGQSTEAAEADEDRDVNHDGVIAALRRERAGYVQRGLKDRASEVDDALKQLGAKPEPRKARTSGAPRETAVESKPRRTASGRGRGKG